MQLTRLKDPTNVAIASIASPFLITGSALLYTNRSNKEFWQSLGPGDSHAAALGAMGEILIVGFFLFLGCGLGLLLNGYSIRARKGRVWFNWVSTIINSIPFALLFALILKVKFFG